MHTSHLNEVATVWAEGMHRSRRRLPLAQRQSIGWSVGRSVGRSCVPSPAGRWLAPEMVADALTSWLRSHHRQIVYMSWNHHTHAVASFLHLFSTISLPFPPDCISGPHLTVFLPLPHPCAAGRSDANV